MEGRYKALNEQLDETIIENTKLQKKINTHNNSFVGDSGSASNPGNNNNNQANNMMESVELVKANYERDENKWAVEKLTINSKVHELEQALKNKEDEVNRRVKLI